MENQWVVLIVGIFTAIGGGIGHLINTRPKIESNNMQRINNIIQHYENMHERCEAEKERVFQENKRMRKEIRELKDKLGGE